MKSLSLSLAAVLAAAASWAPSFPLEPLPYQERLFRSLDRGRVRGGYVDEPDRRTKGRRSAAKRFAGHVALRKPGAAKPWRPRVGWLFIRRS